MTGWWCQDVFLMFNHTWKSWLLLDNWQTCVWDGWYPPTRWLEAPMNTLLPGIMVDWPRTEFVGTTVLAEECLGEGILSDEDGWRSALGSGMNRFLLPVGCWEAVLMADCPRDLSWVQTIFGSPPCSCGVRCTKKIRCPRWSRSFMDDLVSQNEDMSTWKQQVCFFSACHEMLQHKSHLSADVTWSTHCPPQRTRTHSCHPLSSDDLRESPPGTLEMMELFTNWWESSLIWLVVWCCFLQYLDGLLDELICLGGRNYPPTS